MNYQDYYYKKKSYIFSDAKLASLRNLRLGKLAWENTDTLFKAIVVKKENILHF